MRPPPPALSEVLTEHEVRAIVRRVPIDGTPEASLGLGPGARDGRRRGDAGDGRRRPHARGPLGGRRGEAPRCMPSPTSWSRWS